MASEQATPIIPSCPKCGHSVTSLETDTNGVQTWVVDKWVTRPVSELDLYFVCPHCTLEEYASELVMRESTGGA